MRFVWLLLLTLVLGCGMSEAERERAANRAAVEAEEQAESLREQFRSVYDKAYDEGRRLAGELGEKATDEATRAKLLAAYALMEDLDTSRMKVSVEGGVVHLDGTVPTEPQRMKAEGLAYGVTGDGKRVRSTLTVPK